MTKIEGIPEGWELVRIGFAKQDEWVVDDDGKPYQLKGDAVSCRPIIRKIEKPKRYRPFASVTEFKTHRDRWCKIGVCESRVQNVDQQHVYFRDMSFTWEQVFIEITFEDGTPFGIEIKD